MALCGFVLFALLLSNPISDGWLFLVTIILASHGFAGSFTLLSGIGSKTNSGSVLMAVLGFPIIIGVLMVAIDITQNCIDGLDRSVSYDELLLLVAINLLLSAVSYLLFPYIWRS
jgi:heme exporter protein B